MCRMVIIILFLTTVRSNLLSYSTTQTDWSGGGGVSGPVTNWSNTFDSENHINWYSITGQLNLDYSTPMEHLITGSYVNVNSALATDIDSDGDMDILGAAGRYSPPYFFSGRIDWWENNGGSGINWIWHSVDDNFPSAPSVISADIDGDGDVDIIGAARGNVNNLAWWENVDSVGTTWNKHTIPSSIQEASSVDTADVNGDGYIDILTTDAGYHDVAWIENVDGSGNNWNEHTIDGSFNTPYDVFGADVDNDGDIDVMGAAFNSDQICWWENTDDTGTTWNEHVVTNNFNGARSVFASDLDGDGDTDIVGAASLDWAITWWENLDGYGNSWIEHFISSNFNYAFAVYASDIDQDSDTDVLGASYFGDDITLWENTDGSGLNWYEHIIDDNFDGARDVATADMDSDGDPDILGAASEDADISWWDVTCCAGAGELVSSIFDTEVSADWDSIIWTSNEPSGTSIYFQVRSSIDPHYMGNWSVDITTPGPLESYLTDGDRYIQYKALLETSDPDLSPVLQDITISWTEFSGIDNEFSYDTAPTIQLLPNYPNPFNQTTTIEFSLQEASKVTLNIYNILGEEVTTLYSGRLLPGHYSCKWDAFNIPGGVYMYRLEAESNVQTRKMILLR